MKRQLAPWVFLPLFVVTTSEVYSSESTVLTEPDNFTSNDDTTPDDGPDNEEDGGDCNGCDEDTQGDPVNLSRGEFFEFREDVRLVGGESQISLTFRYSSKDRYNGLFGFGWHLNVFDKLRQLDDGNVLFISGAGEEALYTYSQKTGDYSGPADVMEVLVPGDGGEMSILSPNGYQRTFDMNGNLIQIASPAKVLATFQYSPDREAIFGTSNYFVGQVEGLIGREHQLTRVVGCNGNEIELSYNKHGRLSSVTWPGGEFQYEYNPERIDDLVVVRRLPSGGDAKGIETLYSYDVDHNLITKTDGMGQVVVSNTYDSASDRVIHQVLPQGSYQYDYSEYPDGGISSVLVTDATSAITEWGFDDVGHVISIDPQSGDVVGERVYEHDENGRVKREFWPRGNSIEYSYDGQGRKIEERWKGIGAVPYQDDPEDVVKTFSYEPVFGLLKTVTDANGNVTTRVYDHELGEEARGLVRQRILPDLGLVASVWEYTYTADGQVESVTDPMGIVKKYEYDADGSISSITSAFGTPVASTWSCDRDESGAVTKITAPEGRITHYGYDDFGNWTSFFVEGHEEEAATASYNANGRPISIENPVRQVYYEYDAASRLLGFSDGLGRETGYSLDGNDHLLQKTFPDGSQASNAWSGDRVVSVNLPGGVSGQYQYDENGNLASFTDSLGRVTGYSYDDFDRIISVSYPGGSTYSCERDKNGNITAVIDRGGARTEYDYDSHDRLVRERWIDADSTTITWTRDAKGRIIGVDKTGVGSVAYTYSELDCLLSEVGSDGTQVTYEYDATGLLSAVIYPSGTRLDYERDHMRRVVKIFENGSSVPVLSQELDVVGAVTWRSLENGLVTRVARDGAGRPERVIHRKEALPVQAGGGIGSPPIWDASFAWDALNRLVSVADASGVTEFTYDPTRALESALRPTGHPAGDASYEHDLMGNRIAVDDFFGVNNYVTNELNQYTSVGGAALQYDGAGRMTSDGEFDFSYDHAGNLIGVTGDGLSVEYTYDALGRRVEEVINGVSRTRVFTNWTLIEVRDAGGVQLSEYVHSPGVDDPIRMEARGRKYYYVQNQLGSVLHLTDAGAQIVESYLYDDFGHPFIYDAYGDAVEESPVGNPFLFAGGEYLVDIDLYDKRFRAYHPKLGRFMQPDPLGERADRNLYRYAVNAPTTFRDPLGLYDWDWGGTISSASWGCAGAVLGAAVVTAGTAGAGALSFGAAAAACATGAAWSAGGNAVGQGCEAAGGNPTACAAVGTAVGVGGSAAHAAAKGYAGFAATFADDSLTAAQAAAQAGAVDVAMSANTVPLDAVTQILRRDSDEGDGGSAGKGDDGGDDGGDKGEDGGDDGGGEGEDSGGFTDPWDNVDTDGDGKPDSSQQGGGGFGG